MLEPEPRTLSYYKQEDARTLFDQTDKDNSGLLDADEVKQLCKKMGKKVGKSDLEAAMKEMDADGSGEVDFAEFEKWWKREGGKQAKAREPAGVIKLDEMSSVTGTGKKDIMVGNAERSFDLQADSNEEQIAWLEALKLAKPEIYVEPREGKVSKKERKAMKKELMVERATRITAELTQAGPLGLAFDRVPDEDDGRAHIRSIKADSQAADHPQLVPGLKLVTVGGTPTEGLVYGEVIDLLKSSGRPVLLEFEDASVVFDDDGADALPPPPSAAVEEALPPPPLPQSGGGGHTPLGQAIAMHDSPSPEPGDLVFKQGDMVQITEQDPAMGGWWKGFLESAPDYIGNFPGNYLAEPSPSTWAAAPPPAPAPAPAAALPPAPPPAPAPAPAEVPAVRPVKEAIAALKDAQALDKQWK